ncbi:MAG: HYR domain-containing protein [Bacteroidales bacterium]|nr:HYR domain-containing protein [Bacteroidales bacterium]
MKKIYLLIISVVLSVQFCVSSTIYVKYDATGLNNGSSWENAFQNLQQALDIAISGDEIWVARGTYTPTYDYGLGGDARNRHFRMIEGVAIYGGFAGTETAIAQRSDFGEGGLNETILCGDLNGDDVVSGAGSSLIISNNSENCYHLFRLSSDITPVLTQAAILDGFTITGGNANAATSPDTQGGGIVIESQSPLLRNLIIKYNFAKGGGGISLMGPEVNPGLNNTVLQNSVVKNNLSSGGGGGINMVNCGANAEVVNCIISGNMTTMNPGPWNVGGGGIRIYHRAKITNCLIENNQAPYCVAGGGGIFIDYGHFWSTLSVIVTGCTIANNHALNGGGTHYVVNGGEFRNCILWGNTDQSGVSNYVGSTFTYCNSSPLPSGTGNVSQDPAFYNPQAHDYRLCDISPCVNTGNNALNALVYDIRGQLRVQDGVVDMGAYEYTPGLDPVAEAPVLSCPANITQANDLGMCSAIVDFQATLVSGIPVPTLSYTHNPGSVFNVGTTTVTVSATNPAGTAECSFDVTVNDTETPQISCPGNISLNNDPGVCGAIVHYPYPVATDNCFTLTTGTEEFDYTGTEQTWVVPEGVYYIEIEAYGAQGGNGQYQSSIGIGGLGGYSNGKLAVTPGETLYVYVGQQGPSNSGLSRQTAFNGGGAGYGGSNGIRGSGGGASDVRKGGNSLYDRVIVAGGGGGACCYSSGGNGGGLSGTGGTGNFGGGGTQTAGGTSGVYPGSFGFGGSNTASMSTFCGGGGGYYGGGAGNNGGGGSGYIGGVYDAATSVGVNEGHGKILIHWETSYTAQTTGLPTGSFFPVGNTVNTFVTTDNAGNTTSCSFEVLIIDNTPPVISCPANFEHITDAVNCYYTVDNPTKIVQKTYPVTIANLVNMFECDPGQTNSSWVNYFDYVGFDWTDTEFGTVTNVQLKFSVGTQFSSVMRTLLFNGTNAGQFQTPTWNMCTGAATPDNIVTMNLNPGDYITGATNTIRISIEDIWGFWADPVLNNHFAEITVTYIQPVETDPVFSDNCPGATIAYELSGATNGEGTDSLNGVELNPGITEITWTVTDASGNTASCSYTASITDTYAPVIVCPANVQAYTGPTQCTVSDVLLGIPDITENCSYTLINNAPAEFETGVSTVVWTITDASNNEASCQQLVTVTDNQPPEIVCPGNISVNNDPGVCGAMVNYDVSVYDNCSLAYPIDMPGYTYIGIHENHVYYLSDYSTGFYAARDSAIAHGGQLVEIDNAAENNFLSTVGSFWLGGLQNLSSPTYSEPGGGWEWLDGTPFTYTNWNTGEPNNAGQENFLQMVPGGRWNDLSQTFSIQHVVEINTLIQTSGLPSGSIFPIGITTNTFEVFDETGNSSTCSFDVVVTDNELPVISSSSNLNFVLDNGLCAYTINNNSATYTRTYHIADANLFNFNYVSCGSGPYTSYPTAGFNWTDTELSGYVLSVELKFNVGIECESGGKVYNTQFNDSDESSFTQAPSLCSCDPPNSPRIIDLNLTADNYRVGDVNSFRITNNSSAWGVYGEASLSGYYGEVQVTYSAVYPGAADNCAIDSVSYSLSGATTGIGSGDLSGVVLNQGITQVLWTAFDIHGNSNTCTQIITVTDNEPPTITCPANISVNTDPDVCTAGGDILGTPVVTENCTYTLVNDAPETFSPGIHSIIWTVTDAGGNSATCEQTITVTDAQIPTIACPSNVSVNTDPDLCTASGVELGDASTGDNCGVLTYFNDAPETYPVGITTVIWTVQDVNGNTNTCEQTVTVNDTQLPAITCPDNISVNTDPDLCTASGIEIIEAEAADNCGILSLVNDAAEPYALGINIITWTAEDVNGNINTCQQTITVTDAQQPTIECPAGISQNTDADLCSASGVELGMPIVTENCSYTLINDAAEPYTPGEHMIVWTVTDAAGSFASCQQTVTISDNQLPVIVCPADVIGEVDEGEITASNVDLGTPVSSDNCSVASVENNAPEEFPIGETEVEWIVTDGNGNTAYCSQWVTILDPNAVYSNPKPETIQCLISPNPATEWALLDIYTPESTRVSIRLFDASGKFIAQIAGDAYCEKGWNQFRLSRFSPGLYLVELRCGTSRYLKKMVFD